MESGADGRKIYNYVEDDFDEVEIRLWVEIVHIDKRWATAMWALDGGIRIRQRKEYSDPNTLHNCQQTRQAAAREIRGTN